MIALGAVLTAILLWVLIAQVRTRGFDWTLFAHTLKGLDWAWLLVATLSVYGTYYVRALRWAVLIRPVKPTPGLARILSATIIGFTAIALLGRPGEFVRPYLIAKAENVPLSSQLAAWLIERLYDLLIALAIFGFALSRVRSSAVAVGPSLSWVLRTGGIVVAIIAAVCLGVLIAIRQFAEPMRRRLLESLTFLSGEKFASAERLVNSFVEGISATKTGAATSEMIAYTGLEWLLIAFCYGSLARMFGPAIHFRWTDVLIFTGFVSFGSIVQIPGVGGGVQVVCVLVLTEIFGLPLEIASSFAILIWFITFVSIVPLGAILALRQGLSWALLRSVEQESSVA